MKTCKHVLLQCTRLFSLHFLFRFCLVAKNFEEKNSKEEKKNGKIFKFHAFFCFVFVSIMIVLTSNSSKSFTF